MTRIVVRAELAEQLRNVKAPEELVDANGQFLGRMHPEVEGYILDVPPISEEELDRRADTEPRHTTAEVLERLRQLEGQ